MSASFSTTNKTNFGIKEFLNSNEVIGIFTLMLSSEVLSNDVAAIDFASIFSIGVVEKK